MDRRKTYATHERSHDTDPAGDGGIDLLDIAVTMAESWKLLVLAPLFAGLLVAAVQYSRPSSYESRAIVKQSPQVALLTAPSVLAPVIERLGLGNELGGQPDVAIDTLRRRISSAPFGDSFTEFRLRYESPTKAKAILDALIAEVFKQSVPRGKERSDLEAELESRRNTVAELRRFAERLVSNLRAGDVQQDDDAEDYTRSLALLVSDIDDKETKIRETERKLAGLGEEQIVQTSTLPDSDASPISMFAAAAAVGTEIVLLIFVFLRGAIRRSSMDPAAAAKIDAIRNAFNLRDTASVSRDKDTA